MNKFQDLLKLARESIECKLENTDLAVAHKIKMKFCDKKACFVTLTENGELRGCIGSLEPRQELWKDVIENAKHAGFNDFRFAPVSRDELDKIKIEISVLTEPKKLGIGKEVFDEIDNKMGIILKKGFYSATFLPQVWEQLSSKKEFLEHLSRKANLEKDDWKDAEIWHYRVESVGE